MYSPTTDKDFTGMMFVGEPVPYVYSTFGSFRRLDFEVDGRPCVVVLPRAVAEGNPWIWRTEFFGVEPQTELALLENGWHVAYCDVQNMYGSPAAVRAMGAFYSVVVKQGLSPKPFLEGFSRGGLFAFNFAAEYPNRVAGIYADAPVLDFKSWPAGKGKSGGSPEDWKRCLNAYGLTEQQALAYARNPIDNLKPLADAKIPILCVCGDDDKTVPFTENTAIAEKRYKELGGEIKVIVKPGCDHHPHSLKDPSPIVQFILQHANRHA